MPKFVVGAYPSSPAHKTWSPEVEAEYFSLLSNDLRIGSLELPWTGQLHPHDTEWLHNNFPKNLEAVITTIPFVMGEIAKNPHYGIASSNREGRKKAIADIKEVLVAIAEFHEKSKRSIVKLVEIHTAPREIGNKFELSESLAEIGSWNWQGVELAIEHCDAFISGQTPEKGFLSLKDEIDGIRTSGADIGVVINWGRSAIEFRDANRVIEHIEMAKKAGLLRGLIFSGASSEAGLFGDSWIDAHHPFKKSVRHEFGDTNSLLTDELAQLALRAAGEMSWVGIKMGWPVPISGTLEERYQMVSAALDVLDA